MWFPCGYFDLHKHLGEMTHPVATDSFLQPSQEAAMLSQFAAQMAVHGTNEIISCQEATIKTQIMKILVGIQ